MATNKRQRQESENLTETKTSTQSCTSNEEFIEAELAEVNDILQDDERSQKETWQIGKRLKQLMDSNPNMKTKQSIDTFFLWGTALARLASQNDDTTLAEAAIDKFEQMHTLSQGDDQAMGPVGYSLWASSLLIVATEQQDPAVLEQALVKFQQAVDVDGGTTFETRFQYARALKEGADLVSYLQTSEDSSVTIDPSTYYERALVLCNELEEVYLAASKETNDEDDDCVTTEDFAEVKLLEAIIYGLSEDDTVVSFERTFALFQNAMTLHSATNVAVPVLLELSSYVAKKCKKRQSTQTLEDVEWDNRIIPWVEDQFSKALAEVGFEVESECHKICVQKDVTDEYFAPEDVVDETIPHLLHALGSMLVAFLIGESISQVDSRTAQKSKKKAVGIGKRRAYAVKQSQTSAVQPHHRFQHTIEVLRSAHHYHDKLGCYPLACLYACPSYANEAQCRLWLETADTYGVLDEEDLVVSDFKLFEDRDWLIKLMEPTEMTEVDDD